MAENKKKRSFLERHLFKTILGASISAVVIISSIVGLSLAKDLFPDYSFGSNKTLREKIEGNPEVLSMQAEKALIETTISDLITDNVVSNIGNDGELSLTFNFLSSVKTKAVLGVNFERGEQAVLFNNMFEIEHNRVTLPSTKIQAEIAPKSNDVENFVETDLMIITIEQGLNSIEFTKRESETPYLAIDYVYLYMEGELEHETRERELYTFDCNDDLDPFIAAHGGSIEDDDFTYRTEGSENKYRYGNLNGAKFTAKVVVEEDVIVTMHTIGDCRPNKSFSYYASSSNPYISSLSVNDGEQRFVPSDKVYESIGWNSYRNFEIATMHLKAGENVIKFSIGGDNVNICGLTFATPIEIKLSSQNQDNPPVDPPADEEGTKQKLEAEDADIDTNNTQLGVGIEGETAAENNNPSGDAFVYNVNKEGYVILTFNFYSSEATTATFGVCMGRREYELKLSAMYNISVNSVELDYEDVTFGKESSSSVRWYDWHEEDVADISLNKGYNSIVLTKVTDAPKVLNLDYIYLVTTASISTTEERLMSFDINESTDLPSEPEVNKAITPIGNRNPLLPANGGNITGTNTHGLNWNFKYENASQEYRYGEISGYDLTMTLNAEEATTAKLYFDLIGNQRYFNADINGTNKSSTNPSNTVSLHYLKVNDLTTGVTLSDVATDLPNWNTVVTCEVATITLNKGVNIVTFSFSGSSSNNNTKVNFRGIDLVADANITLGSN